MILGRNLSNSSSKFLTFAVASAHYCSFPVPPRYNLDNASHQIRSKPPAYNSRFDFGCLREVDDAVALFHDMVRMWPRPYVFDFTELLSAVVKMRQYSVALHLIDEMLRRNAPVNHYTLNIAINCLCKLKRVDFGFAILGSFFKRGYQPTNATFATLIKGLSSVGRIDDAGKVLKKAMEERLCRPHVFIYTSMIQGLCKLRRLNEAEDMLKEMEVHQVYPDGVTCNILIAAFCKEGRLEAARDILHTMKQPSFATFNALIHGCKGGMLDDALELLPKMVGTTVVACNILVDALCKEGRVEAATRVLDTMKQMGVEPDIFTYNTLINGYCLQGKMDEAIKIMDRAVNSGLKPDYISYCTLMSGYFKTGQVDEVSRIFFKIRAEGLERDVVSYNTMLQVLFSEGRVEEGLNLFKEMEALQLSPDIITCNIVLDGLCSAHRISEAFALLHCMEKEKGIIADIVTYNILIKGLRSKYKVREAKDLFDELPSKGLQPNGVTYKILIHALSREGQIDEAKDLLLQMVKNGFLPDDVTYDAIFRGLLKMNRFEEAMHLLEEMNSKEFIPTATTFSLMIQPLEMEKEDIDSVLFDELIKDDVPI